MNEFTFLKFSIDFQTMNKARESLVSQLDYRILTYIYTNQYQYLYLADY